MKRTLTLALAAAFALPVVPALLGAAPSAEAGGVRFGFDGSVTVRVGGPRVRYRRYHRARRVYIYGGYYSYRFASPPPPRAAYDDCDVPTYYTAPTPAPAPITVATPVVVREPLPRFGIGITAGHFAADEGRDGDDFGVFARLRLTDALELELESAKTEQDDGARVDKRLGVAAYLDLASHAEWAPYLVGGMGVQKSDVDGGTYEAEHSYGEVGGGLRWRLNRNFTVAGDLRVGRTEQIDDDEDYIALTVVPPVAESEEYTRFSLKGILYF